MKCLLDSERNRNGTETKETFLRKGIFVKDGAKDGSKTSDGSQGKKRQRKGLQQHCGKKRHSM